MKYILLMYHAEGAFSESELEQERKNAVATCHELHSRGEYVDASPLQPIATSTSIRVRNDRRSVTDGPFAETKEQLGGYVLIDVDGIDRAIEIAAQFPAARKGTVEIRPLFALENLPST
jgi:hypothetical protein